MEQPTASRFWARKTPTLRGTCTQPSCSSPTTGNKKGKNYSLVASNSVNPFYIFKFTHLHTCTTLHIRLQTCQTLTNEAKEQKLDEKRNKFLSEKFFPSGIETDWATHTIAHISVWVVVGLSLFHIFFFCQWKNVSWRPRLLQSFWKPTCKPKNELPFYGIETNLCSFIYSKVKE